MSIGAIGPAGLVIGGFGEQVIGRKVADRLQIGASNQNKARGLEHALEFC